MIYFGEKCQKGSFENLEANWANMATKYEVCENLLL